ncbi:hypothetical protein P154DRAFT_424964 [Amniculicola lignicola CBS 123094]|uniref:Helicase C-terminal domain-containing protein n=1 Tax=Amniculicola lignicola CBS 123094 TaxID=1392246 RepID=A0A6A5X1A4_9PLEO|nr:hypothetical protein P154DRAFT_424964 [Amniculicola lignicola CBS 123094]
MFGSLPKVHASESTLLTPVADLELGNKDPFRDLSRYIPLGCLHLEHPISTPLDTGSPVFDWVELQFLDLPQELKLLIGNAATNLLEARWIRAFLHCPPAVEGDGGRIVRVYLLPEDWGRKTISRHSEKLKSAVRDLLQQIDVSEHVWKGHHMDVKTVRFDPWASAENVSLFYLFNKLPSPDPCPERIKSRYARAAIEELLDSASPTPWEDFNTQPPLGGLKTRLYPYQARSASLMIQREAAPQLQLDPRLEMRVGPTGDKFYFSARDGSFLQEPRFYETSRGGILAETMGLGKTIICLAVIIATRGHLPQIPPTYCPAPQIREKVGSLADMAASILGRNAIPARAYIERTEVESGIELRGLKDKLDAHLPNYEIPTQIPRMNRATRLPPPRRLVMTSGTIIVVPRNLLHQWQSEIRKHLVQGSLKVLVMDSKPARAPKRQIPQDNEMELRSELPSVAELLKYDIIMFTRNRFEDEISDGTDDSTRRMPPGAPSTCQCPVIGATTIPDCSCLNKGGLYESPLKRLHWLRLIIDEGHNFSSGMSDAVIVSKQLRVERRWVVSGTPAKDLVGIEVDVSTLNENAVDPAMDRDSAVEQRRTFNLKDDKGGAAKALGSLASNFLMVRPWCDSGTGGRLDWDSYIYRHEHPFRKTWSGFSSCLLRTLEGLVVKTRPDDVERDIILPPMRHRVVSLKPCWFDKMTANLFVQVLRANAVTSERSDVDYLFHKNSAKARYSLMNNLRQSNFTWTGFSVDDVAATIETSNKYLTNKDKNCSVHDATSLLESSHSVSEILKSNAWVALSKAHEIGIAVEGWPQEFEESFALAYPEKPTLIGITQLLDGQQHVDSHIVNEDPTKGLDLVGQAAKAKILAVQEAEGAIKVNKENPVEALKLGIPSSAIGGQPLTSRNVSVLTSHVSPKKVKVVPKLPVLPDAPEGATANEQSTIAVAVSPARPKKRRLTMAEEMAQLPEQSSLRNTRVTGTTSAKLSYLVEKVIEHQAERKIIIFYDGDNAAFYIAQCLEMLYVNHRIYAKTLDNVKRSEYVALFNENRDVRVLLIDVTCGALGLNLNAASVVLIVNPINRPGIEAQAIKRAHRIGQTREVLVETLVLEGTIEEAIFKRAKNMSRNEHLEVKTLEDDNKIMDIIQNAQILPIDPGETRGAAQFAPLKVPQQVFGRTGREKYHRYGHAAMEVKGTRKQNKRAHIGESGTSKRPRKSGQKNDASGGPSSGPEPTSAAPANERTGGQGLIVPQLQPTATEDGSTSPQTITWTSVFGGSTLR